MFVRLFTLPCRPSQRTYREPAPHKTRGLRKNGTRERWQRGDRVPSPPGASAQLALPLKKGGRESPRRLHGRVRVGRDVSTWGCNLNLAPEGRFTPTFNQPQFFQYGGGRRGRLLPPGEAPGSLSLHATGQTLAGRPEGCHGAPANRCTSSGSISPAASARLEWGSCLLGFSWGSTHRPGQGGEGEALEQKGGPRMKGLAPHGPQVKLHLWA